MPDSRALSSSHFNSHTAHIRLRLCRGVCIHLRVPCSSKDDTDTLYCQISNMCHSCLPKIKNEYVNLFSITCCSMNESGRGSVFCSRLCAQNHVSPHTLILPPAHTWLTGPSLHSKPSDTRA